MPICTCNTPVLGAPASLIGSELSVYLAPALRFAPVLCHYKIDATPLGKRGKGLEFRWEAPALRFAPPRCPRRSGGERTAPLVVAASTLGPITGPPLVA